MLKNDAFYENVDCYSNSQVLDCFCDDVFVKWSIKTTMYILLRFDRGNFRRQFKGHDHPKFSLSEKH